MATKTVYADKNSCISARQGSYPPYVVLDYP